MKKSGIDWIGEIPDDWKVEKSKHVFRQRFDKGNEITLQLLSPTQKFGVIPQTLYEELTTYSAVKLKEGTDLSTFKTVHKGDFCISLRSFQGGFEYSRYEGVVSPAYQIFYAIKEIDDEYYKYLFKDQTFISKINSYTMSLRDGKNIAFSDFGDTFIPLPPKDTQQRIAEYLDKKVSEIDSIIEESKKSIEEYKAWKQSVIFEAVTGKNLNCKKKDSGIEWIGEIPEGWSTIKFKYLHSGSNVGESIDKELCNDNENDTVFYTAGLNPIHTIYKQFPVWKYTKQNDLLLARNGTPYVYNPLTNAVYSDHIIRVTIKEDYSKKYVQYAIQQSIFNIVVDTVSITTWSASLWNNQFIPLPPRNIQEKIVEIIENKLNKINSLVLEKESLIADLTEYKKSLIFEVVTGKRSV
ncbi:MAG: restriction endonuclease subunit S [Treponema sp.]|nr:restriction endonuclease subunit S [Treponema sp.]